MTITNTLGLLDFLQYFFVKLEKILKDDKVNWKDIPSFIGILFHVKTAIIGLKNLNDELTNSTDDEISQLVARLQSVTQQLSDIIVEHQKDVVQTSTEPTVDMDGFTEDDFKKAMLDNGVRLNNGE